MNRILLRTPLVAAALAAVLVGCMDEPTQPPLLQAEGADNADLTLSLDGLEVGQAIPDRYIVVFRGNVKDPSALARDLVTGHGGALHYTYEAAIQGFSATLPAQAVAAIEVIPQVAYVEQDAVVTTAATQSNPPWGLDRVDQRDLPLNIFGG